MRLFLFVQGLDVAEANVVISYNHMKDSVELCQREGRARQRDCAFVVMEQRGDRPVEKLRRVQYCQEEIIENFDPQANQHSQEQNLQAQLQREAAAAHLLHMPDQHANAFSVLQMYRQRTKAHVEESSQTENCWTTVNLKYSSIRVTLETVASASSKKEAKRMAAEAMLQQLQTA
jgi:hypothetical protein